MEEGKKENQQEQKANLGDKLYDKFVRKMNSILKLGQVCTPKTQTLELFAILFQQQKIKELNLKMLEEFIGGFDIPKIFVKDNKIYTYTQTLTRFK